MTEGHPPARSGGGRQPERFICDVMLGRLARWLRLLGFDTVYHNDADDEVLVSQAAGEDRVLLTRDRGIFGSAAGPAHLLIESDKLEEQLREVFRHFDMPDSDNLFRRCPLCNSLLEEVGRSDVEGRVPEYVHGRYERFAACPSCRRVYWPGSHRARVLDTFRSLLPANAPRP